MNQEFVPEDEFIEEISGDAEQYESSSCINTDVPNSIEDHRLDEMKKKAAELVDLSNDTKKYSFSKKILIAGMLVSLFMCIVCIILKVRYQMDVNDLMAVTIASFGTDGTYGGFYYWKEKNANRAKYAQQFVLLFADEYGVDAAIRIAEVVLKD